jgi:hypothetical protein
MSVQSRLLGVQSRLMSGTGVMLTNTSVRIFTPIWYGIVWSIWIIWIASMSSETVPRKIQRRGVIKIKCMSTCVGHHPFETVDV